MNDKIYKLNGRVDAFTVEPLATWLEELTAQPPAQLIVNLADVTFIDTKGVTTLVSGLKRARQQGGDVILSELSDPVRVIIELMRLDKAFTITPTNEDAIAHYE